MHWPGPRKEAIKPAAGPGQNTSLVYVLMNRANDGAVPAPQETCLRRASVPVVVLHNQRGLVRVRESPKLEWTRGESRWRSRISCWMGGR